VTEAEVAVTLTQDQQAAAATLALAGVRAEPGLPGLPLRLSLARSR
jgi:hypothetical protein